MKERIPKCEDCTWFKIKNCTSPSYGIPMWQTLECMRHNYHPHVARSYEGLCGSKAKSYEEIAVNEVMKKNL